MYCLHAILARISLSVIAELQARLTRDQDAWGLSLG
jgi:hypothetical protein